MATPPRAAEGALRSAPMLSRWVISIYTFSPGSCSHQSSSPSGTTNQISTISPAALQSTTYSSASPSSEKPRGVDSEAAIRSARILWVKREHNAVQRQRAGAK